MLDKFIEKSQFVIVTHNKRTMRRADIMYGVTMEEFGVSKPIGMKLSGDEDGKKRRAAASDWEAPIREMPADMPAEPGDAAGAEAAAVGAETAVALVEAPEAAAEAIGEAPEHASALAEAPEATDTEAQSPA
jgi:chromosome segregation protein